MQVIDLTGKIDYYYLYNGHGDVVQIVDRNGKTQNTYAYDEWGNIKNKNEKIANPFKYAGELYDEETGLYYLSSRYYDPTVGRFISKDAFEGLITNPLTFNAYTYGNNNPVMYIDPTGHLSLWQIDDLLKGIAQSGLDALTEFLSSPKALIDLVYGIVTNKISFKDLASAVGSSIISPFEYLEKNSKKVLSGKPTNAEVVEYGRQLGNVLQMVIGSSAAIKVISKALPKLGKVMKATQAATGCNCFTAGTKVQTEAGEKNIEDIEPGDMVLAKDELNPNGELAYKEVMALYRNQRDDIIKLYVGELVIETTDNHPFYVESKGWVFADELQIGDKLQKADGSNLTIDKVEFVKLDKPVTVYNFTVAEYHTYYITDIGIWVHNTNCIPWSSKSVQNAANQLSKGAKEITVGSRSEAEELFLRLYQGNGSKNTTGMSEKEAKDFQGKKNTYHWDDQVGADGRVTGHGQGNAHGDMPHLQVHDENGKVIRIFFK